MTSAATVTTLTQLIEPLAHAQDLQLWGIELVQMHTPIARIFIEANQQQPTPNTTNSNDEMHAEMPSQGVTITQCAKFSRLIGLTLEAEEAFPTKWTLEVSSPGLQRPFFSIAQMSKYINQELEVTLTTPHTLWPERKKFTGMLNSIKNDEFTLILSLEQRKQDEPESVSINWSQVRKANLVYHFSKPSKPSGSHKCLVGGTK